MEFDQTRREVAIGSHMLADFGLATGVKASLGHVSIRILVGALVVVLLTSCAGPAPGQTTGQVPSAPAPPKYLVVAVGSDFNVLSTRLFPEGSARPGASEVERLVHAGLTQADSGGFQRPQLAEAAPSTENGLWKVFADGRMELTWRIRAKALWQDGMPVTSDDLLFTATLGRDRELPAFRDPNADLISRVSAPDQQTFVVEWKQPYVQADTLPLPLPKHLLAGAYLESKAGFTALPYWSQEFVGAGPFKVRDWLLGSYLILDASDSYVLGRPKIDTIEVRFFGDPNVMQAHLLAGTVDMPLENRTTSLAQALELEKRWTGTIVYNPYSPLGLWPQLRVPSPAIIGDARFRRALLQALNRQEMADIFTEGRQGVAHTLVLPDDPEYADLDAATVRYDYDPRAAAQAIEALGYNRGSDGFFRSVAGEKITVEIRSSASDILNRSKLAAADFWQQVGVAVNPVTESDAQRSSLESRATFPGFLTRRSGGVNNFRTFRSSEAQLPEKGFVGSNVTNYMNPDLDVLIDRFVSTIPWAERMQAGRQIARHLTEQVVPLLTYYDVLPRVIAPRLQNVVPKGNILWGIHEWDVLS